MVLGRIAFVSQSVEMTDEANACELVCHYECGSGLKRVCTVMERCPVMPLCSAPSLEMCPFYICHHVYHTSSVFTMAIPMQQMLFN